MKYVHQAVGSRVILRLARSTQLWTLTAHRRWGVQRRPIMRQQGHVADGALCWR